jgi:hypothetical protein
MSANLKTTRAATVAALLVLLVGPASAQTATPSDTPTVGTPTETPTPDEPTPTATATPDEPTPTATPTPTSTEPTPTPTLSETPTPTFTITPDPDVVRCQRAIAKEAAKLIQKRSKILTKCEAQKVDEIHNDECPDPNAPLGSKAEKAYEKVSKAVERFRSRVEQKCGGKDKICGGDLTDEIGGDRLSWPTTCPNLENGDCTDPIGTADCTGIADCIACIAVSGTDEAIDLVFDQYIQWPAINRPQNSCQAALGREMSTYLSRKTKSLQKCWDKRLTGKHTNSCPDVDAGSGTLAQKTALKIAKAESKFIKRTCGACGGGPNDGHQGQLVLSVSRKCDIDIPLINPGGAELIVGDPEFQDDFLAEELGFVSECPDVTVPNGGPACARPITTLVDIIECLDCVAEFKADCMNALQVPQYVPYPAECNPPTPTPSPTPTPTLTPTGTPSATPTGPTPTRTPTPVPTPVPCGGTGIFQCDGTCPTGKVCVSIDLTCQCDAVGIYGPCGSTFGSPLCWGDCPPSAPICRDFNGLCACSPF